LRKFIISEHSGWLSINKFNIEFVDGRPTTMLMDNELAQTLASILMEDDITKLLLLQNNYEFSFTTKFQLHIKNLKKQPQTFAGENKYNKRTSLAC
jgi:hypothetical protein